MEWRKRNLWQYKLHNFLCKSTKFHLVQPYFIFLNYYQTHQIREIFCIYWILNNTWIIVSCLIITYLLTCLPCVVHFYAYTILLKKFLQFTLHFFYNILFLAFLSDVSVIHMLDSLPLCMALDDLTFWSLYVKYQLYFILL